MCGIVGIYKGLIDKQILRGMTEKISHRGPDDCGYFLDNQIALGHKRLSIIDLKKGKQPIFNEDKSIVIIFNGEIYNYKELKDQLEEKGHQFSTNSDTETIIHAYEEYGVDCLKRFNGMFVFAIYDYNKKLLFLARDRLGIKPLYYSQTKDSFIFASEIKALLEHPDINKQINPQAVYEFFNLQYITNPETIFKNIFKLRPGHYLLINKDKIIIKKYWQLNYSTQQTTKKEASKKIKKLLKQAVKARLISEVPLGAFLSGGIDSSIVVGLMTQIKKESIKTFTIGFENSSYDESKYAQITARFFNTDHYETILNSEQMYKLLPKVVYYLDEPLADAAAVPTFILSKKARKKVTVVLTGEGGDENFAGYQYYKYFKTAYQIRKVIPNIIFSKPIKRIVKKVGKHKYATMLDDTKSEQTLFNRKIKGFEEIEPFMVDDFKKQTSEEKIRKKLIQPYFKQGNFLNNMLKWDTQLWLPDDLLMKIDKTTMANSLEARVPFLDHTLMEYVATLPVNLKLKWNQEKYILRKTFKKMLPQQILTRKKKGFDVPIEKWFSHQHKKELQALFDENKKVIQQFFDYRKIQGLVKDRKNYKLIWRLTNYILWHQSYFK